jgi:hypothetical protein
MFIRGDVTRNAPIKVRQNGFPMNGMMLVTECVVPKKIQVLPCGQPKMEISERYGRPENLGVRFFPNSAAPPIKRLEQAFIRVLYRKLRHNARPILNVYHPYLTYPY